MGAEWGLMAAINKLTAIQIKNAKVGQGLNDGGGLRFIGTKDGGKWLFRYTVGGKRREMGLGSSPQVSLSDARRTRDKWNAFVLDGKDPIFERRRIEEETKAAADTSVPTFAEMAEIAFEARKARLKRAGEAGQWMSPLVLHVNPKIGAMPVEEITQFHIHTALEPIWRKMYPTAKKAIQRTRIVLTHARMSGYDVDPFMCDAAKMMLGFVNHKEKPTPATPWQDIPVLYQRFKEKRSTHFILRFAILTAMRSHAVRGVRLEEIERDVWTVPAERMKGTEASSADFRVPLSIEALNVIEEARAELGHNELLFQGARGSVVTDVAVAKVLNKLGEVGRLHGFRTSFRTWAQDTEAASYDVAETALGHVLGSKVERAYARSDLLEKRRILMQRWADFVTQSEAKSAHLDR